MLNEADILALWVTLKLAVTTTLILLIISLPLAWWLARCEKTWKFFIEAIVALPLVLPPTVLGFYLLLALGPNGPIGTLTNFLGVGYLPFTFSGLVIASVFYSLPFVVQPLQNAFAGISSDVLEAASSLRATPWDRFWSVVMPVSRPAVITAAVMGFAHTVGEFGVVLMIGGNIPGATQVVSIAIYDHVETLQYAQAHWLSGGLLLFSFVVLVCVYAMNRRHAVMLK